VGTGDEVDRKKQLQIEYREKSTLIEEEWFASIDQTRKLLKLMEIDLATKPEKVRDKMYSSYATTQKGFHSRYDKKMAALREWLLIEIKKLEKVTE